MLFQCRAISKLETNEMQQFLTVVQKQCKPLEISLVFIYIILGSLRIDCYHFHTGFRAILPAVWYYNKTIVGF